MREYDSKAIESKWKKRWDDDQIYRTSETSDKPKCYVLDMFPYPSGEGLHVGHPKGYIATDVYSRFQKMSGKEVLHPMGWDAFGLPAENYAIKNKVHPRVAVEKNIARYKEQLESIGFNYDWSREVNTTDPDFYKWTQWIFLKLYEKGLAFESHEPINWCPSCQTGLANEDLEDGKCERCGSVVEKRPMRQWVLRITDYAERLLADIDTLTGWPEHIKESQRNWIGKSEGLVFTAPVKDTDLTVETFSAHFEACYADTFVVIAPDHTFLNKLVEGTSQEKEVLDFAEQLVTKRAALGFKEEKESQGIFTGRYIVDPLGNGDLPIWVASYALADYGTGIVKCSAHDERDFAFAKKYNIPLKAVLFPDDAEESKRVKGFEVCFADMTNGILTEPTEFNGRIAHEARQEIADYLEKNGFACRKTTYRLKDWVFSRQRYWGEPIPLVHCEKDGVVPVPESELPVTLPEVEHYEPSGTGESPLANISEWVNTTCPKCGGPAKRETNTMPQWAGSSWYYLRYIDPKNENALVDKEKEAYWSPVDMYVGGAEHATRHLIYARFWHKFLYDIGAVSNVEPFMKLKSVGLILAEDGRKMSKRYGNVINPDDIVSEFGADALRVYEMFMGPFEQAIAWSTDGLVGGRRFLEKVARCAPRVTDALVSDDLAVVMNQSIKKIGEDIEGFRMNTAVSQLMILMNALEKETEVPRVAYESLLRMLAPVAPFLAEELWEQLGHTTSVHLEQWPSFDVSKLTSGEVSIAVQVNGKVRGVLSCPQGTPEATVLALARGDQKIAPWVEKGSILRVVYIPDKVLNIVVGGD